MNLIDLFETVSPPFEDNAFTFSVVPIPTFQNFRIGCDVDSNPVLLITVSKNRVHGKLFKNFRFKYLQVLQNAECKILIDGVSTSQIFTIVKFTSDVTHLQRYFLQVSEILVKSLGTNPSENEIATAINSFVEIFRFLSDEPIGTAQGLWGELFIIDSSSNVPLLLDKWHSSIYDTFDFTSGNERIEVKSTRGQDRIHFFSADQLNAGEGEQILVASLFVIKSAVGLSLQNLTDRIYQKVNSNDLQVKLQLMISRTLGESIDQVIELKFDYGLAESSLKFYRHQDLPRIEAVNIPDQVFSVSYKSDLTSAAAVDMRQFRNSLLFKYLNFGVNNA